MTPSVRVWRGILLGVLLGATLWLLALLLLGAAIGA